MDLDSIEEGHLIKVNETIYRIIKITNDVEVSSDQETKDFTAIELIKEKEGNLRPTNQINFYPDSGELYLFDLDIGRNGIFVLKNKTKLKKGDLENVALRN